MSAGMGSILASVYDLPWTLPLHLALLLVLLPLTTTGAKDGRFLVEQTATLEGEVGGLVTIPCSFTFPNTYRPQTITIIWRVHNFHGEFIFDSSNNLTHRDYQGRIKFLGSPLQEKTGTIQLNRLLKRDSSKYFCRVIIINGRRIKAWQNIPGTHL
ncbi:paired immunoglobulin-like type 2 receptor alpha [Narcine bancroftii]|uniref:paired immunoglobulin-like type 2 receptor alpha n=1 Tax=Narcine bancroftii TaxID=1343680 RepID=UPI0038318BB6